METSDRLGLSYVINSQASKHVTVNETFRLLDALVQLTVQSATTDQQPASPAGGDAFILTAGKTGTDWDTMTAGSVAVYQDNAWIEIAALTGLRAWVADQNTLLAYDGSAWAALSGSSASVNPAALIGVNATAADPNKLTVKSDSELLSHDDVTPGSGDARKIINKAASGNTASVLFQNGFSGRAEFGLAGDDDFHLKVSADGSVFTDAFTIDRTTGETGFHQPVTVSGDPVLRVVNSAMTLNVPAEFASVQEAIDSLASVIFDGAGSATIIVADGTYSLSSTLNCTHPQAARITVSASTPTAPVRADFTGTEATDETMLRSKYGVIFDCTVQPLFMCGIVVENILFVNTSGSAINAVGSDGFGLALTINDSCFHNFRTTVSMFVAGSLIRSTGGLVSSHATRSAIEIVYASQADIDGALFLYCAGVGVNLTYGAFARISSCEISEGANHGFDFTYGCSFYCSGCTFENNAGRGVRMQGCSGYLQTPEITGSGSYAVECLTSYLRLDSLTVDVADSAIAKTVRAANNAVVNATGTHSGIPVFSPAEGTGAGNNGSYVE